MTLTTLPLSLYVHMPWCVKKCPYCDFNSHGIHGKQVAYVDYIEALLADLDADLHDFGPMLQNHHGTKRCLKSIFFGGGTPSLFAPPLIARLLDEVRRRLPFSEDIEITLETNPGTVEHGCFNDYLSAGVNRLSFGIQSFNDASLKRLGRIHSAQEADTAVKSAQDAGYTNINLDLMYALPAQRLDAALLDVEQAITLAPTHLSHYQLTLEPHTAFAANPPALPDDDQAWSMQEACQSRITAAGYRQYEISAYAKHDRRCTHNLNYWTFGDYLGIGAGAHSKISDHATHGVRRRWKTRHPRAYQQTAGESARIGGDHIVPDTELPFEYMMNALRLIDGVPIRDFARCTGLPMAAVASHIAQARQRGWLTHDQNRLCTTALGQRFLNDVIGSFLP